jgi:uncharacterized protein
MSDFRFSPRANRASEIAWRPWGGDAFDRATREDKPILLAISAVWCHWCHVMDETTYSDAGVIETINRRFIPVRVDNDHRPDVNARYNMGGWPTTAFLAPDGTTLTGATYLPPQQMRRALDEVADFFRDHKHEIAERTVSATAARGNATTTPPEDIDLDAAPIGRLVEDLRASFDREYGGFGNEPKFPQPEVHEFLIDEWRHDGGQDLHDMTARTLLAMARGGTYDHVEGGFFRYSTTRDWSVPHFEKMAEDHAGLIRVLANLVLYAPSEQLRETLVSAVGYVRTVLRDPETGFFAGSQDADEEYYELPLDERRKLNAPYVDRTSYTNWTCALAGSLCWAARALDDDVLLTQALQTLDAVDARLLGKDGLLYHVFLPDGTHRVRGLLTDHVAYARALLDAHEIAGEPRFLERARAIVETILANFAAQEGGFYDRLAGDEDFGRLAVADRPIVDNGLFAETLLRIAALFGENAFRERAKDILRRYRRTAAASGPFAATYARALRRFLTPELTIKIVGDPAQTDAFREAALRLSAPVGAVRTLSPQDASDAQLPADPQPAAYVCSASACGAPVRDAAELRAALDAYKVQPVPAAPKAGTDRISDEHLAPHRKAAPHSKHH